jgi:hypothetical protein
MSCETQLVYPTFGQETAAEGILAQSFVAFYRVSVPTFGGAMLSLNLTSTAQVNMYSQRDARPRGNESFFNQNTGTTLSKSLSVQPACNALNSSDWVFGLYAQGGADGYDALGLLSFRLLLTSSGRGGRGLVGA